MKIIVLSGSPKGNKSITLQSVNFIQKKFPQHDLKIFNIARNIKNIEKSEDVFNEIVDEVKSSDGVLWAFPLIHFLVHSHYKRFIELVFEKKADEIFKNKYTAVLTTSIHWFDHCAHNYMNAICDDLDMKYVGPFSADTNDLLKEKERERLVLFAENFFESIENNVPAAKRYKPLHYKKFDYIPGNMNDKIDVGDRKVIIVTDLQSNQRNLCGMIERFKGSFSNEVEVINLNNVDIKRGCLCCYRCGYDNRCVQQDKDGFVDFYNTKIKTADVLIFAGTIKDRYLSSRWKVFFERCFFDSTHAPALTGKQIGFIISGPFSRISNLRQILEAYSEWQQANLVDFITDEYEDSAEIDALLQSLAKRAIMFADKNYVKPSTFLGVGGRKIFRDDIWGRQRIIFQSDHKYYKTNSLYDFPQKDYQTALMNAAMMVMTKIPAVRKRLYDTAHNVLIKPHQQAIKKLNNMKGQ